ncbi:MAG TPA: PhzF family phenazine biosynthesis protein [Deferrisomatales bacterium]|nr:PhzF family phenazine biosynthesis protein [Deferrisomatales bacterium]
MKTRPIYTVDAFTRVPLRGNPAGVMPFARGLGEAEMKAVAREMNASETAFVFPTHEADVKIRFFTPSQEVPFCGHALVGALTLLEEMGMVKVNGNFGRVQVETGVGMLAVDLVRDADGLRVDINQAAPAFRPCELPADRVLEGLGLDDEDLRRDLPLELAYTGLWHLMVPLVGSDALDGLLPDFRALAALNRELGVMTTHVFVAEGDGFACRDFAPAAGIDEDPVTGSAAGALAAYLLRHREIRAAVPIRITQGDAQNRPGEIRVVVGGAAGAPTNVVVGGHAVVSLRGEIRMGPVE